MTWTMMTPGGAETVSLELTFFAAEFFFIFFFFAEDLRVVACWRIASEWLINLTENFRGFFADMFNWDDGLTFFAEDLCQDL